MAQLSNIFIGYSSASGKNLCRFSKFNVSRTGYSNSSENESGRYLGEIEFPLLYGSEDIFKQIICKLSSPKTNNLALEINYTEDKTFVVDSVRSVTIDIKQSEAIIIKASVSGEKKNIIREQHVSSYLSPSRIYTWNDAIFAANSSKGLVEGGGLIRSCTLTLDQDFTPAEQYIKVFGNFVAMGEIPNVFSINNLSIGFKSYGLVSSQNIINVKNISLKDTLNYNEREEELVVNLSNPTRIDAMTNKPAEYGVFRPLADLYCTKYDFIGKLV